MPYKKTVIHAVLMALKVFTPAGSGIKKVSKIGIRIMSKVATKMINAHTAKRRPRINLIKGGRGSCFMNEVDSCMLEKVNSNWNAVKVAERLINVFLQAPVNRLQALFHKQVVCSAKMFATKKTVVSTER